TPGPVVARESKRAEQAEGRRHSGDPEGNRQRPQVIVPQYVELEHFLEPAQTPGPHGKCEVAGIRECDNEHRCDRYIEKEEDASRPYRDKRLRPFVAKHVVQRLRNRLSRSTRRMTTKVRTAEMPITIMLMAAP